MSVICKDWYQMQLFQNRNPSRRNSNLIILLKDDSFLQLIEMCKIAGTVNLLFWNLLFRCSVNLMDN